MQNAADFFFFFFFFWGGGVYFINVKNISDPVIHVILGPREYDVCYI